MPCDLLNKDWVKVLVYGKAKLRSEDIQNCHENVGTK
jgi:hypothetical protein